jgi:large subunit ribosomal protein L24e
MAVIHKCAFSGRPIAQGTGTMYVRKDGKILYFEGMKAQKNFFKLGRKPRETRWTEEFKSFRTSRMAASAHATAAKSEAPAEAPVKKEKAAAPAKSAAKKAPAKAAKK